MRLLILFSVAGLMHVSAATYSQTVTLRGKDLALAEVLQAIRQQTDYTVFGAGSILKGTHPVTVDAVDMPLADFLNTIFADQPLEAKIEDKTIVLARKPNDRAAVSDVGEREELPQDLATVAGKITDSLGNPLFGASIKVINASGQLTALQALTDSRGEFLLIDVPDDATLEISFIGYVRQNVKASANIGTVVMSAAVTDLQEVSVQGSSGYQIIDKNHPGSYAVIDNKLFNRQIGSTVLERIQNLVPGLVVSGPEISRNTITIRGRASINLDAAPLIVLDNFPFYGDLNTLNPDDISNVTILKDAAASAEWGARAGNGVIILTTKKGSTTTPQVSYNTGVNITQRPDLYNKPQMTSADIIDVERFLFDKGVYDEFEQASDNNWWYYPLTPAVELLLAERKGQVSASEAAAQLEFMKSIDGRRDINEYFMRVGVNQTHTLSVSGNTPFVNYYLSGGYNKDVKNNVGASQQRITLNSTNTFKVSNNLQLTAGINFSQDNDSYGNNPGAGLLSYPYVDLVNDRGNALPVVRDLRSTFTDTAGNGNLLDWTYYPYNEIQATETLNATRNYTINTGMRYRLAPYLNLALNYSFQSQTERYSHVQTIEAYATRHLINMFAQPLGNGAFEFPVPQNGIMDLSDVEAIGHNGRAQLNYDQAITPSHNVRGMLGWEIADFTIKGNGQRLYGYSRDGSLVASIVDYLTFFPQYGTPGVTNRIHNLPSVSERSDRKLSYFGNLLYTFKGRYSVSASGRNDAANIFGAAINNRIALPFWTVGGRWQIDEEPFYRVSWLPQLSLRATYGYNGNSPSARFAAVTTISTGISNTTGLPAASILNPPNDHLRWERIGQLNLGVDFSTNSGRIGGTVEYFVRNARDLLSSKLVDPTLGVGERIVANDASIRVKGLEFTLTSQNLNKTVLQWSTDLLFGSAFDEVTALNYPPELLGSGYTSPGIRPVVGKPLQELYSFPWAGLDPQTGDPRGYHQNEVSTDWSRILQTTMLDSMAFHGTSNPLYYGSMMNTFRYKSIDLSVNLSYKWGYYFRRTSLAYTGIFNSVGAGAMAGHGDYARRWQKPGDEQHTDVPSMVFPANGDRDVFYERSSATVEKGDHIRLENIQVGYQLPKSQWAKLPVKAVRFSAISNLGIILWQAADVDPYYFLFAERPGSRMSFSLTITL